jgi:hypothetical protein
MFKEWVCVKDMFSHVASIMFYIMDDATTTVAYYLKQHSTKIFNEQ